MELSGRQHSLSTFVTPSYLDFFRFTGHAFYVEAVKQMREGSLTIEQMWS